MSYFLVDLTVVKEESTSGQVGNLMKKETRDEKVLPTTERKPIPVDDDTDDGKTPRATCDPLRTTLKRK